MRDTPSPFKDRLGRCYELAGRRVLFATDSPILVHGTIQGRGYPPNPHAWVILPDGQVWEPVSDSVMPAVVYDALFNPVENHRYSVVEVSLIAGRDRHWGPWE
jgi:hypothetical protein